MRRTHDQYFTPASACEVLKRHWDGWESCSLLIEPCVGDGAIVNAISHPNWFRCDISPQPDVPVNYVADMSLSESWGAIQQHYGYATITNPPFSCAFKILTNALWTCPKVAMLLRLSFLEPTRERGPWLAKNPPDLVIVLPRISFTGDGKTDSVTCAWMVWDKDAKQKGIIVSPRP
jgi:hypothetical protein